MHRTNGDSYGTAQSAQGANVHVYRDAVVGEYEATQARVEEANAWQEEIANVIEAEGISLNTDAETVAQMNQLNTAINTKLVASRVSNNSSISGTTVKDALDGINSRVVAQILASHISSSPVDLVSNLVTPSEVLFKRLGANVGLLKIILEFTVSSAMNFFVVALPPSIPRPEHALGDYLREASLSRVQAFKITGGNAPADYSEIPGVFASLYFDTGSQVSRLVFGGPELFVKMPTELTPVREVFPATGAFVLGLQTEIVYKISPGA